MENKVISLIVCGYPATGKTHTVRMLQHFLGNKYNTDVLSTLDIRIKHNLFDLYSDEERESVYDFLCKDIQEIIGDTPKVLLIDGNFNKKQRREKVYSALRGTEVYILNCVVSDGNIVNERLRFRQENHNMYENKASTIDLYHLIKNTGEDIGKDELIACNLKGLIKYDTGKMVAESIFLNDVAAKNAFARELIEYLNNEKNANPLSTAASAYRRNIK